MLFRKIKNKENRGYTFIEIVATIVLVATMSTLAIPRFLMAIEKARASEGIQLLSALMQAQIAHEIEFGSYAGAVGDLDVEFKPPENFESPEFPGGGDVLIRRSLDEYTLTIEVDDPAHQGEITCAVTNGPADICTKIGYP